MYSDDEVEASVAKYLTTELTASRSQLGVRDVVATKAAVFELIAASFMLRPAALFYLTWLASNKLVALVAEQLESVATIIDAAPRVYKTSKRVESTTELSNAESALVTLTAAFAARQSGVNGTIGPSVERFRTSLARFMRDELTKNVVSSGDVTETPEELRKKVEDLWTQGSSRNDEILSRLDNFLGVLQDYNDVRLPDSVVGSMLSRVRIGLQDVTDKMSVPGAAKDARATFLELSTMRTLLLKASSFRSPQFVKAPLVGDATTGTLVGSLGTAPSIFGTVSAPFNFAAGAPFSLSKDGAPVVITLVPGSEATALGKPMPVWADPPALSECAVSVNGGPLSTVAAAAWGSGPAAATALDALTNAGVSWNVETARLEFRSDVTTDGVTLAFDTSTGDRQNFVSWLLLQGSPTAFIGTPVPMDVVAALCEANGLKVVKHRTSFGNFTGSRDLTIGFEDHLVVPGSDFTAVPVGARVVVTNHDSNAGFYRVSSGAPGFLILDRDLPGSGDMNFEAFTETLELSNAGTISTVTSLGVVAGSTGATALGFAITGVLRAALKTFEVTGSIDFVNRGIEVGDMISLVNGGTTALAIVETVAQKTLIFVSGVPYVAGAWTFEARSSLVSTYLATSEDLESVRVSGFMDTAELDTGIERLVKGARYSTELSDLLTGYAGALQDLFDALNTYTVDREVMLDEAIRLMEENGFDRALDLFLSLDLATFFRLETDGVSYLTWVNRKAADVAREVVPVGKDTRDAVTNWRTVATQGSNYDAVSEFPKE